MKIMFIKLAGILVIGFGLSSCQRYVLDDKISTIEWTVQWLDGAGDFSKGHSFKIQLQNGKVDNFQDKTAGETVWSEPKEIVNEHLTRYFETANIAALEFQFLDKGETCIHKASFGLWLAESDDSKQAGAVAGSDSMFVFDIDDTTPGENGCPMRLSHGKGGGTGR